MNQYNITAQVYKTGDTSKQTLLVNQIVDASCPEEASHNFKWHNGLEYQILKIYSVEKI